MKYILLLLTSCASTTFTPIVVSVPKDFDDSALWAETSKSACLREYVKKIEGMVK